MADLNCDVVVRSLKLKMLKSLVSFDGVLNIPCRRAASRGIVRVGRVCGARLAWGLNKYSTHSAAAAIIC